MFRLLLPQDALTGQDTERGLRMLIYDVVCSAGMSALTFGPIMIAFAVSLGASNVVIGAIGAIGPFSQILQIPSVYLVERVRARKLVTFVTGLLLRLCWIAVAAIPFFVPTDLRIPVLLGVLVVYFSLGTFSNSAFLSWIRDVIPEEIMGSFFGKRLAFATGVSAVISLIGAVSIDAYTQWFSSDTEAYAFIFLAGSAIGLTGLYFVAHIPEPRMHSNIEHGFARLLIEPIRDQNYRNLSIFLALWVFAANFAGPFFTVYMLRRLEFPMALILSLTVISQILHVVALRVWGRIADRFNSRSVIAVAGPVFLLCLLAWPLMSMTSGVFTLVFAVLFHALTGMASAGVGLGASNLTLRLAPRGRATAYLSLNALVQGMAAAMAPLLAGLAADTLRNHRMAVTFRWHYEGVEPLDLGFPALVLEGLDFVFLAAVIFGFYALHRLSAVHEEGTVPRREVQREFFSEFERLAMKVSSVAGLRYFGTLAAYTLAKASRRNGPRQD